MKKRPHVALLIEASRGHGRQIIEGVARYAAEHGSWSLRLEPRNIDDRPPRWLRSWKGDGIIVRCDTALMARAVLATGLPLIDVRGGVPEAGLPLVGVDNAPVVEAAFEHFRERGFRHYAWCDFFRKRRIWIDLRRERFQQLVSSVGATYSQFQSKQAMSRHATWSQHEMLELLDWLGSLPRPVAILACDDEQAHLVLDAALTLGLRVPEDAAVMGIDNDEVFCRVSSPPLSSVDVNAVTVGYKAAEALARRMRGRRVPARTMIPPRGVVTRQSTDIIAVDDPEASEALRFIREHACRPTTADDVAAHLAVSRSTLDRCLRSAVGQSAAAAILQVRLSRVKADLAETDLTLQAIATRAGFASVQHLANLFRDRVGVTPGRYRKEMHH
ncbi:MAG: XylR family transcriptional regulator [Planctomycetaceae bacterium]|nr:XylR family transcriptional regulator [Planctomycetaceae bacterium]